MVWSKNKPHPKRKVEKASHGGSRDNAGRRPEIGADGFTAGEGEVAVGLNNLPKEVQDAYAARKKDESKARQLEAPARKTKAEKDEERGVRQPEVLA